MLRISRGWLVLASAASLVSSSLSLAASGTWTNPAGGDWSSVATGNWLGGVVASGAGDTANFNNLDLNGQVNINLAEAITIGGLNFVDTNPASSGSYVLSGNPLTLAGTSSPVINVGAMAADAYAQIDSVLTGTAGFTKNGAGTLRLGDGAIPSTFTGTVNFNAGTINSNGGFANAITVGAGADVTLVNRVNAIVGPVNAAGAGAVLNVKSELPFGAINLRGTWGTGTALSRVNFVGLSQDGPAYVVARTNTSAANVPFVGSSFANTHVHLDNAVFWTRTNSGGNTIDLGALSGTANSVLSGGGEGGGTDATYVIGALNTNTEFAGNIDNISAPLPNGGMSLTKVGTGTLTLSGNLSYAPTANTNAARRGGVTTISNGTLKLTNNAAIAGGISDGTVGNVYSLVDVQANGILDVSGAASQYSTANLQRIIGTGQIAGSYRHDEGQLAPGDTRNATTGGSNTVAGTLRFVNDLTIDGGEILFDMTSSLTTGNDLITVGGALTLGGNTIVTPNVIGFPSSGNYTIATASSVSGDVSGWSVPWSGRGAAPTVAISGNSLVLAVAATSAPQQITWTGSASSDWDINNSLNWRNDTSGVADKFYQNDTVTFADTAGGNPVTNTTVNLTTAVSPQEIKVTANTAAYTISGNGKITNNAKLTKTGSGILNLRTTNDYLGGTTITGGIVDIGTTASAFGANSSGVTIGNATIRNGGVSVNQTLTVQSGTTATLDYNGSASTGTLTAWGGFAGDGDLQIIGVASGRLLDVGSTANFTGDITIAPSILADNTQGTLRVRMSGGSGSFPNSHVILGAGAMLTQRATSSQTLNIGQLTGAAGSTLKAYEGGSGARASTFRIGGLNNDSVFSGTVINATGSSNSVEATNILKVGTGTLTLNGTVATVTTGNGVVHPFRGNVAVEAGTLVLGPDMHKVIFGDGGVTVAATPGGADVRGGKLVLDYTGGSSPAASVLTILDAGYDQATKFSTGAIRSTTLAAGRTLGWRDTGSRVEVAYTLPGDTDLSFNVNFDDLLALAQNYDANGTGKVWSQGDINYDGVVNFDDLLGLAQNYGGSAVQAEALASAFGTEFASDWARAMSVVPEPASLGLLAGGLLIARRRRA